MKTPLILLSFLLLFPSLAPGLSGGPDFFGYEWFDSNSSQGADYQWIDISETGTRILEPGAGNKANVDLKPALIFYGERAETVSVSANGYISTDPGDGGGDATNDCPFPAQVSAGGGARIAVLHDALELITDLGGEGGIYHQYFPSSPHSWHPAGVHVIQWENAQHVGTGGSFDFQVLLFDNFDIVMQYGPGNSEDGSGSTTGIQNALMSATGNLPGVGLKVACDFAGGIPDNYAITFLPPRVVVTSTSDVAGVPGTLRNAYDLAKDGARIEFDPSLSGQAIDLLQRAPNSNSGFDFPKYTCVDPCNLVEHIIYVEFYVAIDASMLPDGLTINGSDNYSLFSSVTPNGAGGPVIGDLRLANMTLDPAGSSLALSNSARLAVHGCTIHGGSGGSAIVSSGDLVMSECDIIGGQIEAGSAESYISDPIFLLHDCTVSGSEHTALEIHSGYDALLENCSISLNLGDGLYVGGDTNLTVRNSTISFNNGVGIHTDQSPGFQTEVLDSTVTLNINTETPKGGGIFHDNGGNLTLRGSTISFNSVDAPAVNNLGGGLCISSLGSTTIEECTFTGNSADFGSAVFGVEAAAPRSFSAERSTFSGNSSASNSALYFRDTSVDLKLCTIAENEPNYGLRLFDTAGSTVAQCTIHDNGTHAFYVGDGVEVSLLDSIVTSVNSATFVTEGTGAVTSLGYNLSNQAPAEFDQATDVLSADPLLGPLGFYGGPTKTHTPLPGSPAIDAARPFGIPSAIDQRGFDRTIDGDLNGSTDPDIGAVEYQGAITVTTTVDETANPGTGLSLREAITSADPGAIIVFQTGLGGATFNLSSPLVVNKDLSIDASALNKPPVISGQDMHRVLEINSASVTLTHLNLTDGDGGGLRVTGVSAVTVGDCGILRCRNGGDGGGVYVASSASVDFRDCLIAGNSTTGAGGSKGGGIYGEAGSSIKLLRTQVSGNITQSLGKGGGIAFRGTASNPGGLEITRCSIVNNTAGDDGGGLWLADVVGFVIKNSTLSGNASTNGRGGGVFGNGSSGDFRHSTIADNRSDTGGGGLHATSTSTFTANHTILAANRNASGLRNGSAFQKIASTGYNLCDDNSLEVGIFNNGDLPNRAAHLAPLANYGGDVQTHALHAISPAIDAGNPLVAFQPNLDQRGFQRIADGDRNGSPRIDIGAVEAGRPIVVDTAFDEINIITGTTSLREALAEATDGSRIVFDRSLSGEGIQIGASQFGQGTALVVNKAVQIDATLLPDGIAINGNDETRCFSVTGNRPVAFHAIEIKNGESATTGGGIQSDGDLVLTYCTLRGNRAANGGGAIASSAGEVVAWNTSLVDNVTNGPGAAVRFLSAARGKFQHCTIVDNGSNSGQSAIGIDDSKLVFYSTIVARNGSDFSNSGTANLVDVLKSNGYNLSDSSGGGVIAAFDGPGDLTNTSPLLGTLSGSSGGWGPIVPLLTNSPARDAGDPLGSLLSSFEVRGYLRTQGAAIDIGAVEFGGKTQDSDSDQIPDWWELFYGLDPEDGSDAAENPDLDSTDNLGEYQNGTDPFVPEGALITTVPEILAISVDSSNYATSITFQSAPSVVYTLSYSADLEEPFTPLQTVFGALGTDQTTVVFFGIGTTAFYQISR